MKIKNKMTGYSLSTENADTYATLDTARGCSAYLIITIFIFSLMWLLH